MDNPSRSSGDTHRNDSEYQKVSKKLEQLRKQHQRFYNPDAEKLPNFFGTLGRRAKGLDSLPRKIRVGRETQKIIGYASNLRNWIAESAQGKGIEIGPDE